MENKSISVFGWEDYIVESQRRLCEMNNKKELGKQRAYACEVMVCDFLNMNKNNNELVFVHNDDIENDPRIPQKLKTQFQSGFDIIAFNLKTKNYKKLQVKYRSDKIHLETTRRNSKKNQNKNASGHISYSSDEFDFMLVVKGTFDFTADLSKELIIFPKESLVNKTNKDILINHVGKILENAFVARTQEMLMLLYKI